MYDKPYLTLEKKKFCLNVSQEKNKSEKNAVVEMLHSERRLIIFCQSVGLL